MRTPLCALPGFALPSPDNLLHPRFGHSVNSHVPKLPQPLANVLAAVPKTELHCHLSGSAPIGLIQEFLREQGVDEPQIAADTVLKDCYTDLDDFLATYYKVPAVIKTPDQFRRASKAIVLDAARENVRYLEIRSSILSKDPESTPKQLVEAIEAGIRDGVEEVHRTRGWTMKAGLIILAQRAGTPEQSLQSAKLAVKLASRPDSLIRGFDLAGSEGQHSVLKHAQALKYFNRYGKPKGLKLTLHAGEVSHSEGYSGVDSMKQALALGADRIGHGLAMKDDPALMQDMIKDQTPVELCPWSNVQINAVNPYQSHPLPQFLDAGVNASLSTDNRMMSKITLTDQLAQLYDQKLLTCWRDLKTATLNGVRGAFLNDCEKGRLAAQVKSQFTRVEKKYRDVINQFFCQTCEHPAIADPPAAATGKRMNKVA